MLKENRILKDSSYNEIKFSIDENGNCREFVFAKAINPKDGSEVLDYDALSTYNSYGIEMEVKTNNYRVIDGENIITKSILYKRHDKYPFLVILTPIVGDKPCLDSEGLMLISLSDLTQLADLEKTEIDYREFPIIVDNPQAFFEENKKEILTAFMNGIPETYPSEMRKQTAQGLIELVKIQDC